MPSVWGVHDFDPVTNAPSGCGWYRIILPLTHLAANGWKTAWREGVPPQEADGYKVIIGQRLDKPAALPIWRRSRLHHRLVYETDDDWFSVPHSRFRNPGGRETYLDTLTHCAQVADIITVSTGPLGEVMARETGHRDIRVLPNRIPGALLDLKRQRNRRKVVVGWQGGLSHEADVAMIAPALRDFAEHHPKAELHMMGCQWPHLTGPVRFTDWVPVNASLDYYRGIDFDIGLAPLTGTVFDQSKSAIKVLEYFGLGIPVLASDCEPYREIVVNGTNGFLIRRPEDWGRRLHQLASDQAMREEMGAKARETAAQHTIEGHWKEWGAVYGDLQ
jgi:glycosyltransferase involved in cell wall biosynthesis